MLVDSRDACREKNTEEIRIAFFILVACVEDRRLQGIETLVEGRLLSRLDRKTLAERDACREEKRLLNVETFRCSLMTSPFLHAAGPSE